MARTTERGPRPFDQRQASTRFLRVPLADWPAVKRGYKTEFRVVGGKHGIPQVRNVPTPALVVGYTIRKDGEYDHALLVLEESWQEPLAAISERSLAREGYPGLDEFRLYWMARTHRRFTPNRAVVVYHVRPARGPVDFQRARDSTFEHLYGAFLDEAI